MMNVLNTFSSPIVDSVSFISTVSGKFRVGKKNYSELKMEQ
jgi:hypothetical protein